MVGAGGTSKVVNGGEEECQCGGVKRGDSGDECGGVSAHYIIFSEQTQFRSAKNITDPNLPKHNELRSIHMTLINTWCHVPTNTKTQDWLLIQKRRTSHDAQ